MSRSPLESRLGQAGLAAYRLGTHLARPFVPFLLSRRQARGKEDAARLEERRGHASLPRPEGALIWFHCASVGEALSVLTLLRRLRDLRPDVSLLVTSGTVTSAQMMAERLPEGVVHQYVPLDHPAYCKRFLDHWRPDLAVWVESEFWPNLLDTTRAKTIPMALVNARMSLRSFRSWRRARALFAVLIDYFSLCLAQDETSAERMRALGADQVDVEGNLKLDAEPLPVDAPAFEAFQSQVGNRPLWVAASTHEGEEDRVGQVHLSLRAKYPGLLTVIAPRHPARGGEIADSLRRQELIVAQRSAGEALAACDIYLADTLGELGLFFRAAPIVLLGGSLVPHGGHNPQEPAQLGCALLFGPHMHNFAEMAAALTDSGGARQVASQEALAAEVDRLLGDEKACTDIAQRARDAALTQQGVTDRVAMRLIDLLNMEADRA